MKSYEVIREEFVPCTGDQRPNTREILELRLEDPARYVQEQYMRERSVEFLSTKRDGSSVIEARAEAPLHLLRALTIEGRGVDPRPWPFYRQNFSI